MYMKREKNNTDFSTSLQNAYTLQPRTNNAYDLAHAVDQIITHILYNMVKTVWQAWLLWLLTIYGNASLGDGWTVSSAHKWVYLDPNKREHWGQQHWPQNNNGWGTVLATHETLEEWVEMKNHPEGKENLPKEWSPRLIPSIKCIRKPSNNTNHVNYDKGCWRNQECSPLDYIEFTKLCVLSSLGCDSEVGINTSQHLKKSLEDSKEMCWNSSNHPKLLITPQIFNGNTTPTQLKHTGHYNGEEKSKKENTCNVGKLYQIVKNNMMQGISISCYILVSCCISFSLLLSSQMTYILVDNSWGLNHINKNSLFSYLCETNNKY